MDVLTKNGKRAVHRISATLCLEFEDEKMAESIFKSVSVDNYQYIHCTLKGKKIECRVESDKPSSLRHTIDDFLACVLTAESAYQSI
ncbi:MAG: hypothetical protein GXO25_04725 [Euryarchaeota archaeon]|nr:hypothetical protein [Euryarchaeota archaeon]